jgi:hypothetical protein
VTFIGGAVTFVEGAIAFIGGAVASVEGAITFVGEGGSAIGRLFKTARVRVGDVKGVNKRDLRRWLITYELKGPLLLMYSLISVSNHSIGSSLWAMLYSAYSTNLLFLLKTYTLLRRSSYLSSLIADL